ncbi:winged helix DNA-binding protein [Sphingomonas sp. AR_OL41]|uniref:winged helix DNA-binding protein n=1 Tax=Sphingomonas sp. AR_OL41 TaxID=3042729 RepID=UPI002481106D|nr:winged helix DNA-binding protein [Sphingomonas sp. AR_OL41]MDH7975440.1 winged helix DNA-binding protein [Sphingomonas sp. AR_OL41]
MTARLDLAGDLPAGAKARIRDFLEREPGGTRKIYAALAHKVWTLLIERRLDDEVRDWHGLLQDVRGAIRQSDAAAGERLIALSDLLGESISLAETSPADELAQRPHARRILHALRESYGFVARKDLLELLKLKTTHLSNVLSQLVAHNLIERRDAGRETEFRLTARGREILDPNAGSSFATMLSGLAAFAGSAAVQHEQIIALHNDSNFGSPLGDLQFGNLLLARPAPRVERFTSNDQLHVVPAPLSHWAIDKTALGLVALPGG